MNAALKLWKVSVSIRTLSDFAPYDRTELLATHYTRAVSEKQAISQVSFRNGYNKRRLQDSGSSARYLVFKAEMV